jgi:hypothetical protein
MIVMNKLLPGLMLIFSISAFSQKADLASARFAENGKMIGVTNLSALSDCRARGAEGSVANVKAEGDRVQVRLRHKKENTEIVVPLERLSDENRKAMLRELLKKKNVLRVVGYVCESENAILAFSIDRVY